MTAPFVIREQSFAEQIQPGINTLMQALQLKQQDQQFQAQMEAKARDQELERLRLAQQQRNAQTEQVLSFMRQLGPEILEDPSLAQHLQQTGLNPKTILKTFQEEQKQQQAMLKAQQDAFISSLPEELQKGYSSALKGLSAGLGQEAINDLAARLTAASLTPEQEASINAQYPDFRDLPTADKVKAVAEIAGFKAQLRANVGPEFRRQMQNVFDAARLEISRARLALARASAPGDKLRAALALLSIINQEISDPLNVGLANPDLLGQPRQAVIEGMFGKPVAKAYEDALKLLSTQIPSAEQPQEQP